MEFSEEFGRTGRHRKQMNETLQNTSTPESLSELRVKVATILGVNQHAWSKSPGDVPCIGFIPQCENCFIKTDEGGANEPCTMVDTPDYPHDLNACSEFEKMLKVEQVSDYFVRLRAIVTNNSARVEYQVWHATAEQRCHAFVATMEGKSVQKGN